MWGKKVKKANYLPIYPSPLFFTTANRRLSAKTAALSECEQSRWQKRRRRRRRLLLGSVAEWPIKWPRCNWPLKRGPSFTRAHIHLCCSFSVFSILLGLIQRKKEAQAEFRILIPDLKQNKVLWFLSCFLKLSKITSSALEWWYLAPKCFVLRTREREREKHWVVVLSVCLCWLCF